MSASARPEARARMDKWKKVVLAVAAALLLALSICVAGVFIHFNTCSSSSADRTWKLGDYQVGDIGGAIVHVDDESQEFEQLKWLDYESSPRKMCWQGKGKKTIVISLDWDTAEATVSDDGLTISGGPSWFRDPSNVMTWIPPEEAEVIRNRPKEPASAPKVPYPLNPGNLGKIALITGPPGSGKSTAAGIIAKKHHWIFYEGDGFLLGFNPYVFPNESQVNARSDKPALIGPGMYDRVVALGEFGKNQEARRNNETRDRSPTDRYLRMMAKDVKRERERVGGDWVFVFAIGRKLDRDVFREVIGDDLINVVLEISLDLVKKRLSGRGQGEEELAASHWAYEPAQPDEPNTISFEIKDGVTREDNANQIFSLIKNYQTTYSQTPLGEAQSGLKA